MLKLAPLNLNLDTGLPFSYSSSAISTISDTEAFATGINRRDSHSCIVCGQKEKIILDHCHIVPKHEEERVCISLLCLNFFGKIFYSGGFYVGRN